MRMDEVGNRQAKELAQLFPSMISFLRLLFLFLSGPLATDTIVQ